MTSMSNPAASPKPPLAVRKYSNRRYYDATHGRHLTLEEIRDLVKDGHDLRVTENATGADITAKVLAQIILDLEAPKLGLFPAPFLAQIIRANDQLLLGFYEKFFQQAMKAFVDYQQLIESQFQRGGMLPAMFPPLGEWTQALAMPFGTGQIQASEPTPRESPAPPKDLTSAFADLKRQFAKLQTELEKRPKPARSRSRAKPARRR